MKVYIVKAPEGEYEGYREPIVKVFADKGKAEEYVEAENAKKPFKQVEKCRGCQWSWDRPYRSDTVPQCYAEDVEEDYICANRLSYLNIHLLFIEEYEVEE